MTTMESQHTPVDLKQFEGHTPGPWEVADGGDTEYYPEGTISVREAGGWKYWICKLEESPGEGDKAANARLIASAPQLLGFIVSKANKGDADALEFLALLDFSAVIDAATAALNQPSQP